MDAEDQRISSSNSSNSSSSSSRNKLLFETTATDLIRTAKNMEHHP